MITCRHYRQGELKEEAFDPTRVSDLLKEQDARLWLDIQDPTDDELRLIGEEFGLHPLSLEDAAHRGQRSKVDVFEGYLSVVLYGVAPAGGDAMEDGFKESEIHAFVGSGYLVTLRFEPAFDLAGVLDRFDHHPDLTAQGGGFLLWALLDAVVDGYLDLVERHEEVADDIEDGVFSEPPPPDIQRRIFDIKREVVRFRRAAVGLRGALAIVESQPGVVTQPLEPYYRDVTDHLLRTLEFLDNVRDLLTSALEAQLAQVSNRLNIVMKKLTAWAGIILIPTLVAGIYGMNFREMPELSWRLGYPLALGIMVASSAALYVVFRRKDWL